MKKITKQILSAALALCLAAPCTAGAVTVNDEDEIMIRAGLASTSSHNALGPLACAHLQNVDGYGEGFRFGYYDEDLNFEELARCDEDIDAIAVMKTQNLCYGYDSQQGRNTYSANVDSDIRVGCYHVKIDYEYDDYEEALEDAEYYDGFVAWIDGEYQVRVGAFFTKDEALECIDELGEGEVVGTSAYGMSVVEVGTDNVLFQFDDGQGSRLAVAPDVTEEDDVQTWFRGYKYRGGFNYERIDGGSLTVVNVLPLEDYVKGVAPYEMGREWPLEALKVQATCARTYVLSNLGAHEKLGFDICNSSWCQVYYGTGSSRADYGASDISDKAVNKTAGQVLWYEDDLATTYYSSSHGGASESISNVWGTKQEKYPYLCGVLDPYEQGVSDINSNSSWKVTYSKSELLSRLQSRGYGIGTKIDELELTYSELGNVIKLTVHWTNGNKNTFKPDDIRSHFGLKSIRFHVNDTYVVEPEEEEEPTKATLPLNGEDELVLEEDIYVITGDGEVEEWSSKPYVLNSKGKAAKLELPEEEEPEEDEVQDFSGTVVVSSSTYVFEGAGWGHQLGMSQFGARAMAEEGFDYDEILEFYFPGTYVDDFDY